MVASTTCTLRAYASLLVGEASSSLGASSLKNFSAVSCCHSFSEAVFLFSLSFLRLICSLHSGTSFKLINIKKRKHIALTFAYSYESTIYYTRKKVFCQVCFGNILYYILYYYSFILTFNTFSAKIYQ